MRCNRAGRCCLLLFACLAAAGCRPETAPPVLPPPVVTVGMPVEREVVDYEEFTGHTDALDTVEIRARVSGYLEKIHFQPGTEVEKDQPLFDIDARPYNSVLQQAKAEVASLEARLKRLDTELVRAKNLLAKNAIAQIDVDKAVADQAEAVAMLDSAKAAVDRANLDIEFTKILSPMQGKIGLNDLSVGNLVAADSTQLATIVSVDPMAAYFDIDERTLLRLQQMLREGKVPQAKPGQANALMALANEEGFPHEGTIDFIEPRVNPTTGTLQIRALFANPKLDQGGRLLAPGLFVRVRVPLGAPSRALLVPEQAIGTDQGQKYVLVVDDADKVQYRRVSLGRLEEGWRVVREGVGAGERVVVKGLQRAKPGINVRTESATDAPQAGTGSAPAAPTVTMTISR